MPFVARWLLPHLCDPKTTPDLRLSNSSARLYGRGHMCFENVPFFKLYCARGIEILVTRKLLFEIALYLNMSKINSLGSDSGSLNQHQLLSCLEPDFLHTFCRSVLCWP